MPGTFPRWFTALVVALGAPLARAGDWPTWRCDAQRSAASADELPPQLTLHWSRELPPLTSAWPDQPKMQFDAAYEPIVVGQRLVVGSSRDSSVTAYDTRSGTELWTFFADGPVRFAPLAYDNRVYFVSDDGYLYCLKLIDGSLLWRFRGGPSDRQVLGNERMISTWPARGAPVIADGMIYFAAGIWPFMGIFLHALDALTGEVVWTNDGDGSTYMKQPHNSDSFAGVAPQGPLVAIGDKLLIPGGRSVPACYDRNSGRMVYYHLAENAKRGGGSMVAAAGKYFFNGGSAFDLETEKQLGDVGDFVALADGRLYDAEGGKIREFDLAGSSHQEKEAVDRKGKKTTSLSWSINELGKAGSPPVTAMIKAGCRLYIGSQDKLLALRLPLDANGKTEPVWEIEIVGTPVSLAAADDKLFASTLEGRIYCFGDPATAPASPKLYGLPAGELAGDAAAEGKVESILQATSAREGYCVVAGGASDSLLGELLRQSKLRIVVLEPDAQKANRLRLSLRAAGASDRVSVHAADVGEIELPPYFASLAIVGSLPAPGAERAALVAKLFHSLRPFGGVACLSLTSDDADALGEQLKSFDLASAAWKRAGGHSFLSREGALPGSADWTHEHADAANTRVSKDTLVKAPLGLLWFGGSTNEAILPRHGHGPQPQVVQGRLFIEGLDLIRAIDIYTGRVLWEASLPGLGELYNNTAHQPGANASGTNYIATPEGIHVAYKNSCVVLDPTTGKQIGREGEGARGRGGENASSPAFPLSPSPTHSLPGEFHLPIQPGATEPPTWGFISVAENYLVGGADPVFNEGLAKSRGENDNHSFSRSLVVMDRTSGNVLWTADARNGFRHNGICIGGSRLYAIDRMSGPELSRLKRRGEVPPHGPRLVVFDLASGKELWSTEEDVFGTWLSYSAERDVLVEAGRVAGDTISDEPKGMRAYRAENGDILWQNKSYSGPAMLHHDTVLMAGKACELLTGAPKMREHPLSGEPVEWTWSRNYGCNTPMASEHLLTFRSGAAGYFDMAGDGGTGNFGGFRSSCSNNLIVAGGILTAPDYTRTCSCSYQNQTSIALVPMPKVETWTSFGSQSTRETVRRLGLNLGAPGDRKGDDGTLWLEYPSVGGASPDVEVAIEPAEPRWFRRHSSQVSGEIAWVAASGAEGLTSIAVTLSKKKDVTRKYTLRLHFAEPEAVQPGERIFDVKVQGQEALAALDVAREAGGRHRGLIKELAGIEVQDRLTIELIPDASSKIQSAILSGIEIQAEGW